MSQGFDTSDSWIKEMKDIEWGISLRREFNLAARIAKQMEETGKNLINWSTNESHNQTNT